MRARSTSDDWQETEQTPFWSRIPLWPKLFVLLLVAGAVFWFFTQPPSTVELRVSVLTPEGEGLEGAAVEVLDAAGTLLQSAQTGSSGSVVLKGLPARNLLLRVAKEGFSVFEQDIDPARKASERITLDPLATPTPSPSPTPEPPVEAPPVQPPVVRVAGPPTEIRLEDAQPHGVLTVGIRDKASGQAINRSHVKVLNSLTDAVIVERDAVGGSVEFRDLEVGAQVYLLVSASGYVTFERSLEQLARELDRRWGRAC